MFVRVKYAVPGGPLHEFDVPQAWVERHPDRYEVVDKEPVATQRPASHFPGTLPKSSTRPKRVKPAKKRASSPESEADVNVEEEK